MFCSSDWTPSSFQRIDEETYSGWDADKGSMWCKDKAICPSWILTDCIMTAWKPRMREGTADPRVKIPKQQIAIIKASVESYATEDGNISSSM